MTEGVVVTLLPCPFCGGEAKWIDDSGQLDTPFGLVTDHTEACFLGGRMMAEWDTIFTAWNTRTASAQSTRIRELTEALEPFVQHGRALGAFADDPGPFWVMTDTGHRDVPAEDFRRARATLANKEQTA